MTTLSRDQLIKAGASYHYRFALAASLAALAVFFVAGCADGAGGEGDTFGGGNTIVNMQLYLDETTGYRLSIWASDYTAVVAPFVREPAYDCGSERTPRLKRALPQPAVEELQEHLQAARVWEYAETSDPWELPQDEGDCSHSASKYIIRVTGGERRSGMFLFSDESLEESPQTRAFVGFLIDTLRDTYQHGEPMLDEDARLLRQGGWPELPPSLP